MRCVAAIIVVSIAFASQAFAVLRPLFPAKASPPFGAEAIVIGKVRSNILQNKRLLQRQSKGCISRETQALVCVTGAFSPLFSAFVAAKFR